MSDQTVVPFRRKPVWYKIAWVILFLTLAGSGLTFGVGLLLGIFAHADTGWLAARAALVCLPSALAMIALMYGWG